MRINFILVNLNGYEIHTTERESQTYFIEENTAQDDVPHTVIVLIPLVHLLTTSTPKAG